MAAIDLGSVLRRLRRRLDAPGRASPTDAELLARFDAGRDEAAFELLVWRHGPAVFGLCRRMLRHEQEAEDAFQAVFLTLARRAGAIGRGEAVGSWLFKVAYRVALRAREQRRRLVSIHDIGEPACESTERLAYDARALLDEEVGRLPDKYRAAVVLCYLQGKTNAEAAQALACPRGTIDSRLAWARRRLRERLERRGVSLSLTALATLLACPTAPSAVAAALAQSTTRLAVAFAARAAAAVRPVHLAEGVLRAMLLTKLKYATAAALTAIAVASTSWGLFLAPAEAQAPPAPRPAEASRDVAVPLIRARIVEPGDGDVVWKEEMILKGHDRAVWCVAFSPDGATLVTGAGGTVEKPGQLILWDAASGKMKVKIATDKSVRSIAFAPFGGQFATAEFDKTAKVRDAKTGDVQVTLKHEDVGVNAVVFSPDGKLLVTANWDNAVRLWNLANLKEGPFKVEVPDGAIYALAFSPDGQRLAFGGENGTAKLLDLKANKDLRNLKGHDGVVESMAFSPDGKLVASGSWDKSVRLWDTATGKEIRAIRGHSQNVLCVTFSPDGKTLASGSGRWGDYKYEPGPGEILLLDVVTGKVLARLTGHTDRIFGLAFSPDGTRLASASWDGTVRIWRREVRPPARATGFVADRLDQLLSQLAKSERTDAQVVEALYLAALGRLPTEGEQDKVAALRKARPDRRREVLEDLLAALMASREFPAHVESLQQRAGRLK